mgnify:CR=1 FL=1
MRVYAKESGILILELSFNRSKFNEVGKNPNDTMGRRDEITGEIFYNFAKRIKEKGANILGGCCNINPEHIKSISSLK